MGDLAADSAVTGGDGRYRAHLSRDWEIWGPNGGYVAAVLLRAAGAHAPFPRPVSLACHFLGVARFGDVDLEVTTLRAGRRSASVRVSMYQGDAPIAEAIVWAAAAGDPEAPTFPALARPDVPAPASVPTLAERFPDQDAPFRFWENVEFRPFDWLEEDEWQRRRDLEPRARGWYRFVPTATFDDPWVEAGRVALLADLTGWPAATRAFDASIDGRWMAPNMDLAVSFHDAPSASAYLLTDTRATCATGGLVGATGTVWSEDGRLLASAVQQMLLRNVVPPTAR